MSVRVGFWSASRASSCPSGVGGLLAVLLLLLPVSGMLSCAKKLLGVPSLYRRPPYQQEGPPPACLRPPAARPCLHFISCSDGAPQQLQQQQQLSLLSLRRNFKLCGRSSKSSSSKNRHPPPLSAADLGAPCGGPLISSVFLSRLSRLSRPLARKLLPQLSFDNPLMLPSGVGMTALMQFVEQQKVQYREHVILTQVGDFFEAYGVDAVMLVEFCGLNPMGGKPKAGCPKSTVQAVLDCLTSEGLSVNVYEELAVPSGVSAPGGSLLRSLKTRVLTQVVSPSSPLYLPSNLPLFQGEIGASTGDSVPVFSLYFSPSLGFCCGEVYVQERRMRVETGLTAEGARSHIDASLAAAGASLASEAGLGGCRGELYVHLMGQGKAKQKALEAARCLLPGMNIKIIRGAASAGAFHRSVLREVASSLSLSPLEFSLSSRGPRRGAPLDRGPEPLPTATASQLGLLTSVAHHSQSLASASASLVPPLHQAILPPEAPAGAARFLQRLLLLPPPAAVADAMQQTLRQLLLLNVLPEGGVLQQGDNRWGRGAADTRNNNNPTHHKQLLLPSGRVPNVGKVVQLISTRKANRLLFTELLRLLQPTADCLQRYPEQLLQPLALLLQHETQQQVSLQPLREKVERAADKIAQVIYQDSETHDQAADAMALAAAAAAEAVRQAEAGGDNKPAAAEAAAAAAAAAQAAAAAAAVQCQRAAAASHEMETNTDGVLPALDDFFQRMESFRCHVLPELIALQLTEVSLAADALLLQLLLDFGGLSLPPLSAAAVQPSRDGGSSSKGRSSAGSSKEEALHARLHAVYGQLQRHSKLEEKQRASREILQLVGDLRCMRRQQLKTLQQQNSKVLVQLQRHLTADALNESLYLKKMYPPVQTRNADTQTNDTQQIDAHAQINNNPEAPRDRNRRVISGCWTTPLVAAAVRRYTEACAAATAEVKRHLEELSAELQPLLPAIVLAAHFTSILQAAGHHAAFACSSGWTLPELRDDGAMGLQVRDLTPYYLRRHPCSWGGPRRASSVSFDMNGIFLLTGENMAGKSTLCRSTLALVLLANAGLFCPCGSGTTVPRYSAFLSSSYVSHDSPLEHKSFFLHEAQQLKAVLENTLAAAAPQQQPLNDQPIDEAPKRGGHTQPQQLTQQHAAAAAPTAAPAAAGGGAAAPAAEAGAPAAPKAAAGESIEKGKALASRSFLILDEPCKGTAPNCGAALLGSLLESLGSVKAQGIVSTHLHQQLSAMPLYLPGGCVSFKHMRMTRRAQSVGPLGDSRRAQQQQQQQQQQQETVSEGFLEEGEDEWHYELADGICSDSNALRAAERAGLSRAVIQRAQTLRLHLPGCSASASLQQQQQQLLLQQAATPPKQPSPVKGNSEAAGKDAGPPPTSSSSSVVVIPPAVHRRAENARLLQQKLEQLRLLLIAASAEVVGLAAADAAGGEGEGPPSCAKSQVLLLPPNALLGPPPAWTGAACVYILLAGERQSGGGVAGGGVGELLAAQQGEGGPRGGPGEQPLSGLFRVYVGESEDVRERLRRHRRKPLWANAHALVLKTDNKAIARAVETYTITKLTQDPHLSLLSLKDGYRKPTTDPLARSLAAKCQQQVLLQATRD